MGHYFQIKEKIWNLYYKTDHRARKSNPAKLCIKPSLPPKETDMNVKAFALAIALSFPSIALADDVCSTSKYNQVLPVKSGLIGKTASQAKRVLRKAFGPSVKITEQKGGSLGLDFPKSKQDTFDLGVALVRNGVVYGLVMSYSNRFQDRLGGPASALSIVGKGIKKKVGGAADSKEIDKGLRFFWIEHEGMDMTLTGQDPYKILLRVECNPLMKKLADQAAESVNLGF